MGRCGRKLLMLLTIVFFSIMALALPAWAAWPAAAPTEAQWIPVMYEDWTYMRDPTGDSATNFPYSDVINYYAHPSGAGAYWWFDGTNIYVRMVVDGNPIITYSDKGVFLHYGLVEEYYHVAIDATGDNNYEWYISIDGEGNTENRAITTRYTEERVYTQYNLNMDRNTDGETGWAVSGTGHPYQGVDGAFYAVQDHVRISVAPGQTENGTPDYFIDYWVPIAWLSRTGYATPTALTPCQPIKMIFGSANHTQHICDDLVGSAEGDYGLEDYQIEFEKDNLLALCQAQWGGYGVLRDTRHDALITNSGSWNPGETVTASGDGWPSSLSALYNLGVRTFRIVGPSPSTTIATTGTFTTNASGVATGVPLWAIPAGAAVGVYTIFVQDPRDSNNWLQRDTFTVAAVAEEIATSTKTVNKVTALGGEQLIYTITVINTANSSVNNIYVSDTIPLNTVYVPSSTTYNGAAIADVAGTTPLAQSPYGYGPISVPSNSSAVFTFRVTVNVDTPDQTSIVNTANIYYKPGNPNAAILQRTASTTVNAPLIFFNKVVDKETAMPGETLVYTISYENVGHADAYSIVIEDILPLEVTYVSCSAAPSGGAYTYQHVTGGPYDSSSTPPITAIKFTYTLTTTPLPPGGTGVFYITVQIK